LRSVEQPKGAERADPADLGRRLPENPLLTPRDVSPSQPALEVVSVFNAGTAVVHDEAILLLRVAERPRSDIALPPGAFTLDFSGPHPVEKPLPHHYTKDDVVGMAFAGFENVGYATAYFLQGGTTALLVTLWLRSLLGPFGHGTWTASIAAVVWRERFSGRGRLDAKVLWAYLVSSLLHGLWDIAPMLGLLALPWMLLVGLASILILRHRLREAHAQQHSGLALAPGPLP